MVVEKLLNNMDFEGFRDLFDNIKRILTEEVR